MSFASKLADLFVEFTLKGVDTFQKGLDQAKVGLDKVREGAEKVGALASAAFDKAKWAVLGFAAGGLYSSSIWQVFQFQLERLSRTLAGLFGPEIQKVLQWVTQLTNRLQNLTDAQRTNVARWVEAAAAGLGVAIMLPRVLGGIQAVIGGIRALTVALTSSGWGAVLVAVGMLAAAFLSFGMASQVVQGGLGRLWKMVQPLIDVVMKLGNTLLKALEPAFAVVGQVFEEFVGLIVQAMPMVTQVIGIFAKLFGSLAAAAMPILKTLMSFFRELFGVMLALLQPVIDALDALGDALGEVFAELGGVLNDLLKEFINLLKEMMPYLIDVAKVILGVVVQALRDMAYFLHLVTEAIAYLTGKKYTPAKLALAPEGEGKGRGALPPRVGGKESFEALWDRLAQASINMGFKTPEQEHLETAKKQLEEQKKTTEAVKQIKPDVRNGR